MDMDERELTRVMGEAVGGVRPPTRELIDGAARRGRRMRRRRRVVAGSVVCVLAGMLAGGSVFGAYLPTVSGTTTTLPGSTSGGPGEVDLPDFSRLPEDPRPPEGKEPLTGRATAHILKELLPDGADTGHYEGQDGTWSQETYASLRVGGWGPTASEVLVNFQPDFHRSEWADPDEDFENSLEGFYSCEGREGDGSMTKCGVTQLADGSVLMLYEVRSGLLVRRHADLLRPDGTRVFVGTANGVDIEGGPVVAMSPPVSLEELRNVVTSERWQRFVDPEVNERAGEIGPYKDLTQH